MVDAPPPPEDGFAEWLADLISSVSLSPKSREVAAVLRTDPRRAAFGSIRDVARLAEVNIATVSRTAQALGFGGWADLQQAFRARYLASLSVTEVAFEHGQLAPSAASAFARDQSDLSFVAGSIPPATVKDVACRIQAARHTLVVAQGSYAAVGLALSHNAQIAGYDVRHVAEPAQIANSLARLDGGDLVIAVNCWQIYRATVQALVSASERSIDTVVLTDLGRGGHDFHASLQLAVPSEGVSFFPSLMSALSVVQAVVVELTGLDPDRTSASLLAAQQQWNAFGLLRGP